MKKGNVTNLVYCYVYVGQRYNDKQSDEINKYEHGTLKLIMSKKILNTNIILGGLDK